METNAKQAFEVYQRDYLPGCRFRFSNGFSVSILEHTELYAEVAILDDRNEFVPCSGPDNPIMYLTADAVAMLLQAVATAQTKDELFCFLDTGL